MVVNPFEAEPASKGNFTAESASNIFRMSTQEAKENIIAEASDLGKAAFKLNDQLRSARKTKDKRWLSKLETAAKKLGAMLLKFLKHAIELAAFKLVIEFCALVMTAVFDALVGKGNKPMEISTPGVYFSRPSASGPSTSGGPYQRTSPYDYGRTATASPW